MSDFQQVDRMLKDDHFVGNPIKIPIQSKVMVINLLYLSFSCKRSLPWIVY